MITTEEWLTALESGNYPQGVGRLKSESGYCCLGVGAELCGTLDVDGRDKLTASLSFPHKFISDLPDEMWFKVNTLQTQYTIDVLHKGLVISVSSLNDNGVSFAEIAQKVRDTIEKGLG